MPRVLVDLLQSTGTKGGIETYAREIALGLSRVAPEWELIGLASTELMASDTGWFPGRVIDARISGENRLTWAWGELVASSRAASAANADVLLGPAMFGPLRSRMPVVIAVHDVLYFSHPELMQTRAYTRPVRWMERRGAANASRIITISEYSARQIHRHLRVPPDRIDLIPLAARASSPAPGRESDRADDLFLAMGQRSPYKDFETVVSAWSRIPIERRPRLVITGSHGDDPLRPLVARLGLESWVALREWVPAEELARLRSEATALIDSTLATGFSLPTVEAMRAGLPVILADTEVFREVGGDAAFYYRAGDADDLAARVAAVGADREGRAGAARRGAARWADRTWDDVARSTVRSLQAALDDPRRIRDLRR